MIKKNLKLLIITSVITLLPILAGLILWNSLPNKIPAHFNIQGVADDWSGKVFAVFGFPVFLLAVHWFCTFVTSLDPKSKNITQKSMGLVLWICPSVSLFISGMIYAYALGAEFSINTACMLFFGFLFVIVGNYIPKCKQNYSIGIKISWTLNDEGNWNYTHRLAGKVWVAGGLLIIATSFLNLLWIFPTILIIMIAIPVAGSYIYYKKEKSE